MAQYAAGRPPAGHHQGSSEGHRLGQLHGAGRLEVYSYNGKNYGVPYDMGAITFWYNKDLLAKVGYKTFPATGMISLTPGEEAQGRRHHPHRPRRRRQVAASHIWWTTSPSASAAASSSATRSPARRQGFNDPTFVKAGQMLAGPRGHEALPGRVPRGHVARRGGARRQRQGRHGADGPVGPDGGAATTPSRKKGIGDKQGRLPSPPSRAARAS